MSAAADSLVIRPATEADLPALLTLRDQLNQAMEVTIEAQPEQVTDHLRHFLNAPDADLFVAQRGDRVVGLISLNVRRTLLQPKPVALIDELVVADSARGHGVGQQLIRRAVEYAKGRGCCELEVGTETSNTAAREFYRRCGFDIENILLEMEFDG